MEKFLVAYVPVLHRGYLELFKCHAQNIKIAYILGEEILRMLGGRREIRALDPITACALIRSLGVFGDVQELRPQHITDLARSHVILSSDALVRLFADRYLAGASLEYDSAFLRWDETNVFSRKPIVFSRTSTDPFDQEMMGLAASAGAQSSDWWRRVGGLVVKNGVVVLESQNQHLPTEHAPYINGDPRDVVEAGQHSELCSSIHGEQALVAEAARAILEGTDVYVTTFPCPVCAKLLAYARIRRLFFRSGHSSLDGQQILESYGVEVIHVPEE